MIDYATEMDGLVDDLVALHSGDTQIDARDLDVVAACRTHVLDALTDLFTQAVGPIRPQRVIGTISDLHAAPAAFLQQVLRTYPRLEGTHRLSPTDLHSTQLHCETALRWRSADRHATLAAHAVQRAQPINADVGWRSVAAAEIAAVVRAATNLDASLGRAFAAHNDARAGDLDRAVGTGMRIICREVQQQHSGAPAGSGWEDVRWDQTAARPIAVRGPGDVVAGLRQLNHLLRQTDGRLDVRGLSAVVASQARTHHVLHQVFADRAGPEGSPDAVLAHGHLDVASRLADVYRNRRQVAALAAGDPRPALQAGEIWRAIDGAAPTRSHQRELVMNASQASLMIVEDLRTTVDHALRDGFLLVRSPRGIESPTPWARCHAADGPTVIGEAIRAAATAAQCAQQHHQRQPSAAGYRAMPSAASRQRTEKLRALI